MDDYNTKIKAVWVIIPKSRLLDDKRQVSIALTPVRSAQFLSYSTQCLIPALAWLRFAPLDHGELGLQICSHFFHSMILLLPQTSQSNHVTSNLKVKPLSCLFHLTFTLLENTMSSNMDFAIFGDIPLTRIFIPSRRVEEKRHEYHGLALILGHPWEREWNGVLTVMMNIARTKDMLDELEHDVNRISTSMDKAMKNIYVIKKIHVDVDSDTFIYGVAQKALAKNIQFLYAGVERERASLDKCLKLLPQTVDFLDIGKFDDSAKAAWLARRAEMLKECSISPDSQIRAKADAVHQLIARLDKKVTALPTIHPPTSTEDGGRWALPRLTVNLSVGPDGRPLSPLSAMEVMDYHRRTYHTMISALEVNFNFLDDICESYQRSVHMGDHKPTRQTMEPYLSEIGFLWGLLYEQREALRTLERAMGSPALDFKAIPREDEETQDKFLKMKIKIYRTCAVIQTFRGDPNSKLTILTNKITQLECTMLELLSLR